MKKMNKIFEPLKNMDTSLLKKKIKMLKQSDGEGWAIGEVLQRYLEKA